MVEVINNLAANIIFIFERLNWVNVLDLLLVATTFFVILMFIRGTQSIMLVRGAIILIALLALLASFDILPAFSWLVKITLPAILFSIPVIFAPEIRHGLERLGRAGTFHTSERNASSMQNTIKAIVYASARLASKHHGALIVIERHDHLAEIIETGVYLDAKVTPEILLQIFYPNTPLHDGAVIISGSRIVAAACVLPLSSSGVLTESPERQMGLRHRAALGISEVSDAIAIVVSEETGSITIVQNGRMIRRLDAERLRNILNSFFKPPERNGVWKTITSLFSIKEDRDKKEKSS